MARAASVDGRFVTFHSEATNLVPGDSNGVRDVFVFDRQARQVERVSVTTAETQAAGSPSVVTPSGNGRFGAFHTESLDSVQGFFLPRLGLAQPLDGLAASSEKH